MAKQVDAPSEKPGRLIPGTGSNPVRLKVSENLLSNLRADTTCMKTCGTCKRELAIECFAKRGKSGRQSKCKECHAAYRREHYEKNRQKYIDKAAANRKRYRNEYRDWLKQQSCADCGINDYRLLEQDHLRDKLYNIGRGKDGRKLSSLQLELAKCETVCANCHRLRTWARGGWEVLADEDD